MNAVPRPVRSDGTPQGRRRPTRQNPHRNPRLLRFNISPPRPDTIWQQPPRKTRRRTTNCSRSTSESPTSRTPVASSRGTSR
ncbi:hypothetical protein Hfx1150_07395 [Haloferax sp. CBA1150]|nr:hypothetical protein Hfx1150_07395 [Haloferax sp. CBA1150]